MSDKYAPEVITSFNGTTVEIYKWYDWDEVIITNEADGVPICVAVDAKKLFWILREYYS